MREEVASWSSDKREEYAFTRACSAALLDIWTDGRGITRARVRAADAVETAVTDACANARRIAEMCEMCSNGDSVREARAAAATMRLADLTGAEAALAFETLTTPQLRSVELKLAGAGDTSDATIVRTFVHAVHTAATTDEDSPEADAASELGTELADEVTVTIDVDAAAGTGDAPAVFEQLGERDGPAPSEITANTLDVAAVWDLGWNSSRRRQTPARLATQGRGTAGQW